MKKVLSLILALVMSASCASYILADEAIADEAPEEDAAIEVAEEEEEAGPYDKAVTFLNAYGIYKGKAVDNLAAEDDIERWQMALLVARISTGWVDDEQWEDGPENKSIFTDVDEEPAASYLGAISYANQKGIIEGYGNGKFGPTDGITYQNALTMVVRTLGYQGLEWPWGYIEKAVNLGLTDGITGVAYTDVLTRGEVCQILYNALFATTKNGTTLALQSFGIEFGWEKIVIVASDLNTFIQDNKDATKALESDYAYNYFKNSVKTDDSGKNGSIVAFKLLNDDGTLGDDTYYAYAEEFGLSKANHSHDDEAVVGDSYYVLFEKDADSNLVSIYTYESLLIDTLWNLGLTDDKGKAQEYPIENFKNDYALVSKYSSKSYVNVTASTKPEVIVFTANNVIKEEYVSKNLIAIDWTTGDILQPVEDEDEDDGLAKDDDGNILYEVAWYYNELLNRYYDYQTTSDGTIIGINWMSEDEFVEFYNSDLLNVVRTREYAGFETATTSIAKSAYASLKLFDTNLDGVADRGIYESYKLGYFSNSTVYCSSCGVNKASYKIANLNSYAAVAAKTQSIDLSDTYAFNTIIEGTACAHIVPRAWFVEGYEPLTDEDGDYVDGYVIYSYDAETGAIKVVKNIEDGTDADTFASTGVVRAYNVSNATVTIGDTQYKIDYDELAGTGFYHVNATAATKAAYTGLLRSLFNQFVEYVVVDGKLVYVTPVGATKTELIVVDSYAGLSSDGYIVINGYSTSDLKYEQFRIGSYNNWMKGDYYYYLTDAKARESFSQGAIYAISSYDEKEDVYYVQLAGEFTSDGTYEVDTDYATLTNVSIKATSDGYMTYTVKGTASDKKMKDEDKYVIIPENITGSLVYAPIYVYEGKLQDGWAVTGQELGSTTDRVYVIVNATDITGFQDTYKTSLVILLDDTYYSANYNGADSDSWYLLGATTVEVAVFDVMTGTTNKVYVGTNVDLKEGHMYYAVDGVLVEDVGVADATAIVKEVNTAYPDADTYYAASVTLVDGSHYNVKDATRFDEIEDDFLVGKVTADGYANFHGDKVTSTAYFIVTYNTKGVITGIESIAQDKIDDYVEKNNITTLTASLVFDVNTNKAIFYINPDEVTTTVTSEEQYSDEFDVVVLDDAKIVGQVIYTETTVSVGGVDVSKTLNILGVKYSFEGDAVEGIHAKIAEAGYAFGTTGDHIDERYTATYSIGDKKVNVVPTTVIYDSIVAAEYADADVPTKDCADCELVQSVEFRFNEDDVQTLRVTINDNGDYTYGDDIHILVKITDTDGTVVFESNVLNHITAGEYYYAALDDGTTQTFVPATYITGHSVETIVDAILGE